MHGNMNGLLPEANTERVIVVDVGYNSLNTGFAPVGSPGAPGQIWGIGHFGLAKYLSGSLNVQPGCKRGETQHS